MDLGLLKRILLDFKEGKTSLDECIEKLKDLPFEDIKYACIDHHRSIRKGIPEVIFGLQKDPEEIISIMESMIQKEENVLVTKLSEDKATVIKKRFPDSNYYKKAKLLTLIKRPIERKGKGKILIISAGTSDIPIAEEAYISAKFLGNDVEKIYDVGVAGIHRVFAYMDKIKQARVIIVIAGMEGALPSVISGLVEKPVIAVPTSVGYGTSFSGITPLLSMLNSCSPGVLVVNIDNGFGAAYAATLINRM